QTASSVPGRHSWLLRGAVAGLFLVEGCLLVLCSDLLSQAGDGRLFQKIARSCHGLVEHMGLNLLMLTVLCFLVQGRQGLRELLDFYPRSARVRLLAIAGHLACLAYVVVMLHR